jgi:NADH:ubiquinone oxidoreductase subunit 6 (subunit J)
MVSILFLLIAAILFAIQAIRARRLIASALWLAGVSALLSIAFYLLGAVQVAVIELSVGAGLVTVLFVFAISVIGDEMIENQPSIPRLAGSLLVILFVVLLGIFGPAITSVPASQPEASLAEVLWQQRGLDVLVQMVLIFSGVLGLLGLLAETKAPLAYPVAEEYALKRAQELEALQQQSLEREREIV